MNKTLSIIRHEIVSTVSRKSFLVQFLGIPLIAIIVLFVLGVLGRGGSGSQAEKKRPARAAKTGINGYVDHAGIIQKLPRDIPPTALVLYADEAVARRDMDSGKIDGYYIIPRDFVNRGEVIHMDSGIDIIEQGRAWQMRSAIFENLLGNDPLLIARARQPMNVAETPLAPQKETRDLNSPGVFVIPYVTALVFYILIIVSSTFLLHSVAVEKKNRVMEILIQSVTPRRMLTGKVIGLGLVGILQTIVWLGTGFLLLHLGMMRSAVQVPLYVPSTGIIVWGVVFFLLGYAVYASLMAGVGVMSSSIQEASQSLILVIWPLVVPLLFHTVIIREPSGMFSVILSMIPLTAPVAMMTRLAAGPVPVWQTLLSAILMFLTGVAVVRAVAGIFHAGVLLSGQSFSFRRYVRALWGRSFL